MVIQRADRVLASTERLKNMLAARYRIEPPSKFATIPNGYDEEDFAEVPRPDGNSRMEFLVLHAGSVNPHFRDPRPVFAAAREAADAGDLELSRLRFRFLGAGPFGDASEMRDSIHAAGLDGRVEFIPRIEYARTLAELTRADLLLLLQDSPDTESLVPAKLFEYLRAGRPVLAVGRPGASAELLATVGGGWASDPRVRGALRSGLSRAYRAWQEGTLGQTAADPTVLKRFSRQQLTAELASRFDSLVPPGPSPSVPAR